VATRFYVPASPADAALEPAFDSGWRYTREAERRELFGEKMWLRTSRVGALRPIAEMRSAAFIPGARVPLRLGWVTIIRYNYEDESFTATSNEGTIYAETQRWEPPRPTFRSTALFPDILALNRFNAAG